MPEEIGAVEPVVEPMGLSLVVGGSTAVGGSSGGAVGSCASGGDVGSNGSPPRDSTTGKGAVVEEVETTEASVEIWTEDVMFRPAVASSSHRPVTKQDLAEFLSDQGLARLLEYNPTVGMAVLTAQEE